MSDTLLGVDRTVPYDKEAERAVVGAVLAYEKILPDVFDALKSSDFYTPTYGTIFEEARRVYLAGGTPDPVTVANSLTQHGLIDGVGGRQALLISDYPVPARVSQYVDLIKNSSTRRRLIVAATGISDLAYDSPLNTNELMNVAERSIYEITTSEDNGKGLHRANISGLADDIGEMWMSGGRIRGFSTGFHQLDTMLSGLERQKMYLCGARPGMGKSAWSLNVATNVALRYRKPVAVFSLEMSETEVNQRLTTSLAHIPSSRLESGYLDESDWLRLADAAKQLDRMELLIDDDSMVTVDEMYSRCRRLKTIYGDLPLVVVDYLQLMSGEGNNRQEEVSKISRRLKIMGKELDCAVLALSQLNRNLEERQNKRPLLSDLRESGSLEQDSNAVIFIYRDEIYNPTSEYRGMPELIVAKNRSGPNGTCRVAFVDDQTRFAPLSREA